MYVCQCQILSPVDNKQWGHRRWKICKGVSQSACVWLYVFICVSVLTGRQCGKLSMLCLSHPLCVCVCFSVCLFLCLIVPHPSKCSQSLPLPFPHFVLSPGSVCLSAWLKSCDRIWSFCMNFLLEVRRGPRNNRFDFDFGSDTDLYLGSIQYFLRGIFHTQSRVERQSWQRF